MRSRGRPRSTDDPRRPRASDGEPRRGPGVEVGIERAASKIEPGAPAERPTLEQVRSSRPRIARASRVGRGGSQRAAGDARGAVGQTHPFSTSGGMTPGWPRATGSGPSVSFDVSTKSTPSRVHPDREAVHAPRRRAVPLAGDLGPEPVVARLVARAAHPEVLEARVGAAAQVRAALRQGADVEGRPSPVGSSPANQPPRFGSIDHDERSAPRRHMPGTPRRSGARR